MNSMTEFLSILTGIMGLLTALGALWVALKKRPSEIRVMDADAATKLSSAATSLVEPLQKRIDALESDMAAACEQIDELEKKVKALKVENGYLVDWAQRLVHQVQSLGGHPVEMTR